MPIPSKAHFHASLEHKARMSLTDRFMSWVIDAIVATAGFTLFCIALAFTPLAFPKTLLIASFISTTVLQLVLLPIMLIKQKISDRHAEMQSEALYLIASHLDEELDGLHDNMNLLLKQVGVVKHDN